MPNELGYVIFYVADVRATVSFFANAFSMAAKFVTPENDYGELDTGSTTLAFAAISLGQDNLATAGGLTPIDAELPPVGASITVVTSDVPGTVSAALAVGGQLYVDPVDKPWGQTVAYIRDPNGILIEVATAVSA
ncbi:MAG: VOC family protein [Actinobacteria bacterium]|nr:VOC family protein [Actinomycetota bacterium]